MFRVKCAKIQGVLISDILCAMRDTNTCPLVNRYVAAYILLHQDTVWCLFL
jgi:hypothetical protein